MSDKRSTRIGLAIDEVRLSRALNRITVTRRDFPLRTRARWLTQSIACALLTRKKHLWKPVDEPRYRHVCRICRCSR